jgi:hypothetical protein
VSRKKKEGGRNTRFAHLKGRSRQQREEKVVWNVKKGAFVREVENLVETSD